MSTTQHERLCMADERAASSSAGDVFSASTDGAYTLLIADFSNPVTAWEAYEMLKTAEADATTAIDGVVVVKRNPTGRLDVQRAADHSTRTGLEWGLVGGIVVGVIFPSSVLGSAAILGSVGAAVGKLRGRHHRRDLADELEDSIAPGHLGVMALVADPSAIEIRDALDQADAIVNAAIAPSLVRAVKAAAKDGHH